VLASLSAARVLSLLLAVRAERLREWLPAAHSAAVLWVWQPLGITVTVALTGVGWLVLRYDWEDPLPGRRRCDAARRDPCDVQVLDRTERCRAARLSFTVFRLVGVVLDVNALRTPVTLFLLALRDN
jgi:hypothetical protein